METNIEKHIEVCEARSYARCIGEGMLMAADHVGVVMKHTWPAILLSLLLPFPGLIIYVGGLDRLLTEWRDKGYVPRYKPMEGLRKDGICILRALARMLFFMFVSILVLFGTWAAWHYLPYGAWMAMATFTLLTLVLMPSVLAMMEIACTEKPLAECMLGWIRGFKHYGSLFAFQLLLFMLTLLIMIPGMLPIGLTGMATQKAWEAIQEGDLLMMPPAWPLVLLGANIIMSITLLITVTIRSFAHMLFWGSIKAREPQD
ncbi:MAG: hypothetical protein ACI4B5_08625 [Bacteroidaceae bacterium]